MTADPLATAAILTSLAALLYGLRLTLQAVCSPTTIKRTALIAGMTGGALGLLVIMWL